jgi:hypothetical protein
MYSEGWEAIQWESCLCIVEDVLCLSYYSMLNDIELYHAFIPEPTARSSVRGTNSPRLFTLGETKALAKSKVHQISRALVTNDVGVLGGWSSSLISKIWRTVINSGH